MNRQLRLVGLARVAGMGCQRLTDQRVLTLVAALVTVLLCLLAASASRGQALPTVSILPGRSTAHEGDTVIAHVYINDVTYLGEADVGISVDERCLRIADRPEGTLFPAANGVVTTLSSIDDHEARLAFAITDRSLLASGGGIFYSVQLEVTCASGTAPLDVTFASLSVYKDPAADPVELQSYTLFAGNLHIVNAHLQIGPVGEQTRPPATPTLPATATPVAVLSQTPPALVSTLTTLNVVIVALLVILIFVIVLLILWLTRRFFKQS